VNNALLPGTETVLNATNYFIELHHCEVN